MPTGADTPSPKRPSPRSHTSLADEWEHRPSLRVNAVVPGPIRSPLRGQSHPGRRLDAIAAAGGPGSALSAPDRRPIESRKRCADRRSGVACRRAVRDVASSIAHQHAKPSEIIRGQHVGQQQDGARSPPSERTPDERRQSRADVTVPMDAPGARIAIAGHDDDCQVAAQLELAYRARTVAQRDDMDAVDSPTR